MPIQPLSLTYLRCANYSFKPGHSDDYTHFSRPYHSITFVAGGSACYTSGARSFSLHTGDILFTPCGSTYVSRWSEDTPVELTAIHFNFKAFSHPYQHRRYDVQALSGFSHLHEMMARLVDSYENAEEAFGWYAEFFELCRQVWPKLTYTELPAISDRIERAVRYLEETCTQPVTVEELADLCCMSTSHFYARFKQEMGCSPIRYKHRLLMEHAGLLLLDDSMPTVSEVAEKLGFESSAWFCRVFRQCMGCTPMQYRERMRGMV